jgi:hypothetical protein
MMGLDTPETFRGWRYILRISCATSWVFFTLLYRDARSAEHKKMNLVQLAAEVIRRGNYVDHTGIVANQSYRALTDRKQDTTISATDVLKARSLMYTNLCSFCRTTVWDLAFLYWGGRTWRWNVGTYLENYMTSRTRGQRLHSSDWRVTDLPQQLRSKLYPLTVEDFQTQILFEQITLSS